MGGESDGSEPASPSHYQAWLFGPFRVRRNGVEIDDTVWSRKSARTLLKWFLLNTRHSFSAAELCEVLWPGARESDSINKLHVALHSLRHILEPDLPRGHVSTFIRTDHTGNYSFDPGDSWWTDVGATEWLWQSARTRRERDDKDGVISVLQRVLGYYGQGFLLEELYDDAFAPFREAQERKHDETLHTLLVLYSETGHRYEVMTCAQQILDRDPYSECAVMALVEVHVEQGNLAAAITELDRFIEKLADDLGVEPSSRLTELRERVLLSR